MTLLGFPLLLAFPLLPFFGLELAPVQAIASSARLAAAPFPAALVAWDVFTARW